MKGFFLLLLLSSQLICIAKLSADSGYDWPRWRGPNGDGISRETDWNPRALENGPPILWRVDIGFGFSNVTIQGNRLYTVGYDADALQNIVWCLDAKTGQMVWRYVTSGPGVDSSPQSTPVVDGDDLFVLRTKGLFLCLEAKNGKVRWQKDLVAECGVVKPFYDFAGSPVVVGNLVILTANSSGMTFDRKNGELVWSSDRPPAHFPAPVPSASTGTYYSTPVLNKEGGEDCAIIAGWEGLSAVRVKTGERVWLYP
jgi:outer membrane protein assembly factor BamB